MRILASASRRPPDWRIPFALLALASATQAGAVHPSLCEPAEESIFWCETPARRFELCASRDLDAGQGFMQYRAGSRGHAEFVFPAGKVHPRGQFQLSLLARGTVLQFQNAGYSYDIHQPLAGRAVISVAGPGRKGADIQCRSDSDTLTLTSTMNRFARIGIYK